MTCPSLSFLVKYYIQLGKWVMRNPPATIPSSSQWLQYHHYKASSLSKLPRSPETIVQQKGGPPSAASPMELLLYLAAVVTTPSYSLDAMYSIVRKKCRLGISIVADSWLVCRLEWMSSIRPLRYLVVILVESALLHYYKAVDVLTASFCCSK